MKALPFARNKGVVVQDLDEEILVYDLLTNKAYCLNQTASRVYRACEAKSSFAGLKRKHNFTDDVVFLALDELKRANLVDEDGRYLSPFAGLSRREAIRRVGVASMIALPVISSLVAPSPAHAQSLICVNPGGQLPGTVVSYPGVTCGASCANCPCALANCNMLCCSGVALGALDNSLMTLCTC